MRLAFPVVWEWLDGRIKAGTGESESEVSELIFALFEYIDPNDAVRWFYESVFESDEERMRKELGENAEGVIERYREIYGWEYLKEVGLR